MIKFRKFLAVIACVVMMLTLPGCEEVIPLTKDEEKIISEYSAHMISKYNMLQNEGYMFVMPLRAQEIMDEIRPPEPVEEEVPEENPEEENSEDNSENSGDNSSDSGKKTEEVDKTVYFSLSESLGLDKINIEAVYTGIEFTDRYDTVVPAPGKTLAVMHVALVNKTAADVPVNMIEVLPDINVTFNKTDTAHAELTILENDLGTFTGTVPAGDMVETILLFQVTDAENLTVNSLKLKVTHDDESYDVMLVK